MANHGANQSKKEYIQPPAEDRYNSLEVSKKLACYRYWCHLIEERNTKLWHPKKSRLRFGIGGALIISRLILSKLVGLTLQR
jgi:hypothetical protein